MRNNITTFVIMAILAILAFFCREQNIANENMRCIADKQAEHSVSIDVLIKRVEATEKRLIY